MRSSLVKGKWGVGCGAGENQKRQRVSDYGQGESFGLRSWPNRGGRLGDMTRKE